MSARPFPRLEQGHRNVPEGSLFRPWDDALVDPRSRRSVIDLGNDGSQVSRLAGRYATSPAGCFRRRRVVAATTALRPCPLQVRSLPVADHLRLVAGLNRRGDVQGQVAHVAEAELSRPRARAGASRAETICCMGGHGRRFVLPARPSSSSVAAAAGWRGRRPRAAEVAGSARRPRRARADGRCAGVAKVAITPVCRLKTDWRGPWCSGHAAPRLGTPMLLWVGTGAPGPHLRDGVDRLAPVGPAPTSRVADRSTEWTIDAHNRRRLLLRQGLVSRRRGRAPGRSPLLAWSSARATTGLLDRQVLVADEHLRGAKLLTCTYLPLMA